MHLTEDARRGVNEPQHASPAGEDGLAVGSIGQAAGPRSRSEWDRPSRPPGRRGDDRECPTPVSPDSQRLAVGCESDGKPALPVNLGSGKRPLCGTIPHDHLAVHRAERQETAVLGETGAEDVLRSAVERTQGTPTPKIPELESTGLVAGGQRHPVGREGEPVDDVVAELERQQLFPRGQVPELDSPRTIPRGHTGPLW